MRIVDNGYGWEIRAFGVEVIEFAAYDEAYEYYMAHKQPPLLAAQIILYNELRVNPHYVKYELPACKQSICKAIVCALYQLMCKRKILFGVSSFLF